jgi:hypothetical protein
MKPMMIVHRILICGSMARSDSPRLGLEVSALRRRLWVLSSRRTSDKFHCEPPGSGYVPDTGPAFFALRVVSQTYCGLLGFVPFRC